MGGVSGLPTECPGDDSSIGGCFLLFLTTLPWCPAIFTRPTVSVVWVGGWMDDWMGGSVSRGVGFCVWEEWVGFSLCVAFLLQLIFVLQSIAFSLV